MTDKEKIETLQKMVAEAKAMMDAAAQYAGEHNIPLKYVNEYADPDDSDDDEDVNQMTFGGQGFTLNKHWKDGTYKWYNSNCVY